MTPWAFSVKHRWTFSLLETCNLGLKSANFLCENENAQHWKKRTCLNALHSVKIDSGEVNVCWSLLTKNVLKSSCFHEYWILHVLRFTDWTPFPYCWIRLCTVHGARGSMPCINLAFYLCTECLGISAEDSVVLVVLSSNDILGL